VNVKTRKQTRRLRLLIAASAGALLVAIAFATVAMGEQQDATPVSDDTAAILAERQQYQDAVEAWDAEKEAAAANEPEASPTPPPYSPDAFPEGIFGRNEADSFEHEGYEFLNVWMHATDEANIAVYAGSFADSKYGVLLVQRMDPYDMSSRFERIDTDIFGPVEIVSVEGMTVTVAGTETDARATFDVSADPGR
jgi:hypothetical protein